MSAKSWISDDELLELLNKGYPFVIYEKKHPWLDQVDYIIKVGDLCARITERKVNWFRREYGRQEV